MPLVSVVACLLLFTRTVASLPIKMLIPGECMPARRNHQALTGVCTHTHRCLFGVRNWMEHCTHSRVGFLPLPFPFSEQQNLVQHGVFNSMMRHNLKHRQAKQTHNQPSVLLTPKEPLAGLEVRRAITAFRKEGGGNERTGEHSHRASGRCSRIYCQHTLAFRHKAIVG